MFVVVILFTRLLVSEERNDISLGKALGFTGKAIRNAYFLRYLPEHDERAEDSLC